MCTKINYKSVNPAVPPCPAQPAQGGSWCVTEMVKEETVMEAGRTLAASSTYGAWLKQCHVGRVGKRCLEQELLLGRAGMTGLPCQAPACNPQCRSAGRV